MAENAGNAFGNVFGENQAQASNYNLPGAIHEYQLLPNNKVERPFEPISEFAVRESGVYGPMNGEQLKEFLKINLDKRLNRNILDEIAYITPHLLPFLLQLERLRHRILQIRTHETDLNNFLKLRIRKIIKALEDKKQLPLFSDARVRLTNLAREALQEAASVGPLGSESNLEDFIQTGRIAIQVSDQNRNQVIAQLNKIHLKMSDIEHVNKANYDFACKKIIKAIGDILTEIETHYN